MTPRRPIRRDRPRLHASRPVLPIGILEGDCVLLPPGLHARLVRWRLRSELHPGPQPIGSKDLGPRLWIFLA